MPGFNFTLRLLSRICGQFPVPKVVQVLDAGNFHGFEGAKPIGSSGDHSDYVVETLDGTTGKLAFGTEPVEQKYFMVAQHTGNFPHRFQPAAHGAIAPGIQKARCPEGDLYFQESRNPNLTSSLKQPASQLYGALLTMPTFRICGPLCLGRRDQTVQSMPKLQYPGKLQLAWATLHLLT